MVGQVSGGRGCGGRRRRLMVVVLMVELLLLHHQVMVVLRQVRIWRRGRVRVSGMVRKAEGAKGAVIVVSRGRRGPLTPRAFPGPSSSATSARPRGRDEEDLPRQRILGQLISHRNRVPSRRGRSGAGRKIPRRHLWVGTGRRPVGRVPLVRQEGVGGRRRLGPHARQGEVRLLRGGRRGEQTRTRQRRPRDGPGY